FLAISIARSSTSSMYLQPASTRSPGQPSAYLCPRSDERTSRTLLDVTFSLAIIGRLSANQRSCSLTRRRILLYASLSLGIPRQSGGFWVLLSCRLRHRSGPPPGQPTI